MVKLNQNQSMKKKSLRSINYYNETARFSIFLIVVSTILILQVINYVDCRDKGDDIIMTKGKLIVRGGKGKGNLILDTGSKSSHEHGGHHSEMMPMMAMMHQHFNPYSFYPMQQQHHHQAPMMIHPIYVEDHSAMQTHHEPEHHHHEEQHHEYQHHGMEQPHVEYKQHHHEESQQHHHEEPNQMHHMLMEHHQAPMMMGHPHQHYEHEGAEHHGEEGYHHGGDEEAHHGGYETHPMMQIMLHHQGMQQAAASGASPEQLQQLASMHAMQNPLFVNQMQQHQAQFNVDPANIVALQQQQQNQQLQQQQSQIVNQSQQQQQTTTPVNTNNSQQQQQSSEAKAQPQHKKFSLMNSSANNPFISIIKPLFKRDPSKQKKP